MPKATNLIKMILIPSHLVSSEPGGEVLIRGDGHLGKELVAHLEVGHLCHANSAFKVDKQLACGVDILQVFVTQITRILGAWLGGFLLQVVFKESVHTSSVVGICEALD